MPCRRRTLTDTGECTPRSRSAKKEAPRRALDHLAKGSRPAKGAEIGRHVVNDHARPDFQAALRKERIARPCPIAQTRMALRASLGRQRGPRTSGQLS